MPRSLIQPLFEGPLDIVGDVHGEIDGLRSLLAHLGYDQDGFHAGSRRLVFVGDLTDRGPDSPAVVELVQRLVDRGRAQCVLGNHDLNILLGHRKHDNKWFYGEEFFDKDGRIVPQVLADASTREQVLALFGSLPLALERNDLLVVHACWRKAMIDAARAASDAVELYRRSADLIERDLASRPELDDIDRGLERQNRNPVKVLTSGLERRIETPFEAGGKTRHEERVPWWEDYRGEFCVFGHYSLPYGEPRGDASAFCVDFGVGKRWTERRPDFKGPNLWKLAAVRFPERVVVFDDGGRQACRDISP